MHDETGDGDQVDATDADELAEPEDDAPEDLFDDPQPAPTANSDESTPDAGRDEVAQALAQLTGPEAA